MLPKRLDLEITQKCKFKCGVCSVASENKEYEYEVTLQDLFTKINEFYKLGGSDISLSGGEPSERGMKFLYSLISYCKKLNLNVRMYTVGYGFQNYSDVLLLKKAGLDSSYISLEGSEKCDSLYKGVKNSYEIAIRAISLFKKAGVEVVLHFTPTSLNYFELSHVVEVANKFGIEKVRIMAFVEQGRGFENRELFAMNENQTMQFRKQLEITNKKYPHIRMHLSGKFSNVINSSNPCSLKKNRLAITAEGVFIPSFSMRLKNESNTAHPLFNLGNIYQNSFDSIWNSTLYSSARESPSGCGICPECQEN